MVPFVDALAELFSGETARAVGRQWRERFQLRFADGEDVAVGGEPVAFFPCAFLVLFGVAMVEHLHFYAVFWQRIGLQILERYLRNPDENARIASRFQMPPLNDQFKIGECL